MQSQLILGFIFQAIGSSFKRSLPASTPLEVLSPGRFSVPGPPLRSLAFELIFIQGVDQGVDIEFFQNHLLKMLSFLQCIFFHLCHKSGGCSYMDLCLGQLFYSIDQHTCFVSAMMVFFL